MKYLFFFLWTGLISTSHAQFIINNGIDIANSAHLVTNGDWQNDGMIVNNGRIVTSENWINTGDLVDTSTGGFVIQSTAFNTFIPGGKGFGYLRIDGSADAYLEIGLRGDVTLKDSLILKSGILRVIAEPGSGEVPMLTLGASAKVEAGNTAFVDGMMSREGSGNLLFPLGKNDLYLPVTIHKVAGPSARVTASIEDAPAGYSAGPGVEALIDFPYAWRISKNAPTDTAAYVELNYPNALPVVANPIVARETSGSQYASMGARLIDDSNGRATVRSYSRRLSGLFTVAQGFPSDPVTDSLALVALFQESGGPAWTNRTNWLTGTIDTWHGITVNGQSITNVDLSNNNLQGPVADPLVDILSLQTVNLSSNAITTLPDFTLNPEISALNVSDNNLDFASLEPNAGITGINYFIQGEIGTALDTAVQVNTDYLFTVPAGGQSSEYTWKRNGEMIAQTTNASYLLPAIGRETMGEYTAEVTNTTLPGLVLKSAVQKVLAHADVTGKLFIEANIPAEQGDLILYRVQPGAFEPVATVQVQNDGSYNFEEVILDNYQILGFADTILYERALPTYYKNTIFWEEADTLSLENNLNNLDIVSHLEPGPPSGRGSISGYLQEDDGTGRLKDTERNKRIARAGVSARRVQKIGRTKEEILTLVAYVYTNENGEFTLPNLPTGEYRLNFQYPGYPMDETSYTTITIGTAFESQVMVEANVINNKIHVSKLVITGLYHAEGYRADVYPNPAVDHILLRFPSEVKGRVITLTNMNGKTIASVPALDKEVAVDVRPFNKGIYIMQILEHGIKVKTLKISIE